MYLAFFKPRLSLSCPTKQTIKYLTLPQGGPTGENLASGYPNVSASVIAWGHERVDYDFDAGEFRYMDPQSQLQLSY
jgi:hypothetical protein